MDKEGQSGAGRRSVGDRSAVGERRSEVGRRLGGGWSEVGRRSVGGQSRSVGGRSEVGRPFYNTIIDSRLPLVM